MRCNIYYPKDKEKRIIKKFLIFPVEINCERRWLERVTIKQKFHKRKCVGDYSGWRNIKFINN